MRRVAGQLDVQPSALYWHVKDKQSLLALVCDQLLADLEVPELTGCWRDDVRTRALLLHQALLEVRDAAELTASVVALGTGGHRMRELISVAAEPAPDAPELLTDAAVSLLLGDAMIAQQRAQAEQLGLVQPAQPAQPAGQFAQLLSLLLR